TSWQQAAAALGYKEGTVASRIARARGLLQERLARRGITLSAALTACVLWNQSASACVPAALVKPTVKAALPVAAGASASGLASNSVAALFETGAKTLPATKIKIATALLLAAGFVGGIGWALGQRLEGESEAGRDQEAKNDEPSAASPKP